MVDKIQSLSISFFDSTLNNANTNLTYLNVLWASALWHVVALSSTPFSWPVSCEKQFSTNYCHNMNKFKTENISTEYFQ